MPTLDFGLVKGPKGDPFTYEDFTSEQLAALKGAKGDTPIIKAGFVTALDCTAAPTVSAKTSGITTTFNFGIPKGDTSTVETPTFDDTTSTYSTLTAANTAAETASTAIKSKVSLFTTLSNIKKSFSAIVQGLKILGTNVGAITGITSDLAGESETVAASIKAVNTLNASLNKISVANITFYEGITNVSNNTIVYHNDYFAVINACVRFDVKTHPSDNYLPIFDINSFKISRRQDYRVETNMRAFVINSNGNKTTLYAYVSADNISETHAFQWVVLI